MQLRTGLAVCSLIVLLNLAVVVRSGQAASKSKEPVAAKSRVNAADRAKVTLSEVEVSAVDLDSGKAINSVKAPSGGKLSSVVDVAENQKFLVKFSVRDATGKAVKADQAFVRLSNAKADREVVLVSEVDGDGYKVDLDTGKRANDFNRLAGTYEIRVDVGDVNFANAISAHIGSVKLSFVSGVSELPNPLARYQPKPEIKHLFREPEKRPPATVSFAFSIAVLAPFALLLGLWAKLGINFKNFDFHPTSMVFYASLGAIFYLYYMFWLYLNMFTTLKYLTGLGLVAALTGSHMYARMYRRRTGRDVKEKDT